MGDPPDRPKLPTLKWDKTKTLNINSTDPIFLMMTRVNSADNLTNVSPFLIKKAIDITCTTEVLECKKTRGGQILIKTKNSTQAKKLITLTALNNNIEVEITPHALLNSSKGIFYCNDLRGLPESEILQELASQNVIEIKKILKKVNDGRVETGLIIVTFGSSNLPHEINIGYLKVPIRQYIPQPMRCKNCFKYNHSAKYCNNPKICPNCGNLHHTNDDTNEKCIKLVNCSNCCSANISPTNHTAFNKKCPVFIKESELQAIKTTMKIDHKAAKAIYNQRHQHDIPTYASVTTNPQDNPALQNKQTTTLSNATTTQQPPSTTITHATSSNTNSKRNVVDYTDLPLPTLETNSPFPNPNKMPSVKILPRKTSKRLQNKLKAINNNNDNNKNLNSTDSEAMDL